RETFCFTVASWVRWHKEFLRYWDSNTNGADWDVARHDFGDELIEFDVIGRYRFNHPGIRVCDLVGLGPKPLIVLCASTLWQYLCGLLIFHKVGELRRCENPSCPAPRFIANRKNQIFCSSDCAALVAKRRWWAKHG